MANSQINIFYSELVKQTQTTSQIHENQQLASFILDSIDYDSSHIYPGTIVGQKAEISSITL